MLDVIGYVVLGFILLALPGFLFSLVLYPNLESLDFWTRVGMSLALGAMLVVYVGYLLARPELAALQLGPFVAGTAVLCVVFAVLAYFRGGFEVIIAYARAVRGIFRKFKLPKPPLPPKPEQPEEKPKEQPAEQPLEEKGEGG